MLGLVVTDLLHRRDPEGAEGAKSRRRARLVSAPSLARRAEALGLPELLRLGRGEEKTGGREKSALWANAYEAVIAALYLDGGFEAAHRFVGDEFAADVEDEDATGEDPKSALQELLQGQGRPLPEYRVAAEEGPSHRRRYRIECRLDDGVVTDGRRHLEEGGPAAGRPPGSRPPPRLRGLRVSRAGALLPRNRKRAKGAPGACD